MDGNRTLSVENNVQKLKIQIYLSRKPSSYRWTWEFRVEQGVASYRSEPGVGEVSSGNCCGTKHWREANWYLGPNISSL